MPPYGSESQMRCLIDADSIIFRCGFAVEHKKYNYYIKGEEHNGPFQVYDFKREVPKELQEDPEVSCIVFSEVEPLQNALHLVKQEMEGIISATGATSYSTYIKGKGNFREALSVTRVYKGNRDAAHRPRYEFKIRDYLKEYWDAEEVDGMETDDKVAMEQWADYITAWKICSRKEYPDSIWEAGGDQRYFQKESNTIICTIDKDLDQIPGWHYNFQKKEKYWVTAKEAMYNFYMQLLSGDSSDNIQGVKGIGKAGAKKFLDTCKNEKEMYLVTRDKYLECYGDTGLEVLTEMANLLWLKRSPEDVWKHPQ